MAMSSTTTVKSVCTGSTRLSCKTYVVCMDLLTFKAVGENKAATENKINERGI